MQHNIKMPKRTQASDAPKAKRTRVGQLELDELKRDVLKILPVVGGLTLNQIVAHPLIVENVERIYGSVDRKAFTVIKNFLLCGLDSRFILENGQYKSNPGGVDGRKSISKRTTVRVHCIETGKTCIVTDAQFLAELMYGNKGRSGAHAALMQNGGKRDVYKGFTWNVVAPNDSPILTAEAAHAFFAGNVVEDEPDTESEVMAGDAAADYEPDTESEVMAGDAAADYEPDTESEVMAGDAAADYEPDTESEVAVEDAESVETDSSIEFDADVDTD